MKVSLMCTDIYAALTNQFTVDRIGHYIVEHCTTSEHTAERKKKEKYCDKGLPVVMGIALC